MRAVLLLFLGIVSAHLVRSANTTREVLLVLPKGDHTLAIVDRSNLKVFAKAPGWEDLHEVIASSDGKFAYVSNYGGGAYNTLALIDLVAQKALSPIDLGALRGPHGLVFAGQKTWFTAEGRRRLDATILPKDH